MEFLNKVEIKGVVGKATTQSYGDNYITNFSVVTEYCGNSANGAIVMETTWWHCTAWDNQCPNCTEIQKGDKLHVIGRLRQRKYIDQDNNERVSTDVVVQSIEKIAE